MSLSLLKSLKLSETSNIVDLDNAETVRLHRQILHQKPFLYKLYQDYQHFHHEAFDPTVSQWSFDAQGPLSSANGALAWIIFKRDAEKFKNLFPQLELITYTNHTPLRYLLSGGFTLKQLIPSWSYNLIKNLEQFFSGISKKQVCLQL